MKKLMTGAIALLAFAFSNAQMNSNNATQLGNGNLADVE